MRSSHVPPWEANTNPAPIMTAPNTAVPRMPKRSAIQPNAMAPAPEPSHASAFANAGTERVLPRSAAMALRATGAISGAPYENVKMKRTTPAAIQDARVSTVGAAAGESAGPFSVAGNATQLPQLAHEEQP